MKEGEVRKKVKKRKIENRKSGENNNNVDRRSHAGWKIKGEVLRMANVHT